MVCLNKKSTVDIDKYWGYCTKKKARYCWHKPCLENKRWPLPTARLLTRILHSSDVQLASSSRIIYNRCICRISYTVVVDPAKETGEGCWVSKLETTTSLQIYNKNITNSRVLSDSLQREKIINSIKYISLVSSFMKFLFVTHFKFDQIKDNTKLI